MLIAISRNSGVSFQVRSTDTPSRNASSQWGHTFLGGNHFIEHPRSASRFLYAVRVQHDITGRKLVEQTLARRMDEQAALFEFSEQLQTSLRRSSLRNGIGCDRARAWLRARCHSFVRPVDVMRFVAWRGLSDGYRQAVEGHSPWPRDEKDAQPVCFQDVAGSDLSDDLKETIAREEIGAVAFIPILARWPARRQVHGLLRCPALLFGPRGRRGPHSCAPAWF